MKSLRNFVTTVKMRHAPRYARLTRLIALTALSSNLCVSCKRSDCLSFGAVSFSRQPSLHISSERQYAESAARRASACARQYVARLGAGRTRAIAVKCDLCGTTSKARPVRMVATKALRTVDDSHGYRPRQQT